MKLILSPFDPAAPGSHAQRMRMMELIDEFGDLKDAEDAKGIGTRLARLMVRVSKIIEPRLRTDDGSPVADALALLSADDYDVLMGGMLAEAGEDAVPLESTATSTASPVANPAPGRRRGQTRS